MEPVKNFFVATIILMCAGLCYAQVVDPPYAVCTWSGFRSVCVSYTFDDNEPNQLAKVVPMFNEYGYALTLFTLSDPPAGWKKPNWTGLVQAAAQGHEIASHTVTHSYLNTLTEEQQREEFQNSNDAITAHIPGLVGLTMAYPYCVLGKTSLPPEYYIGARGCQGSIEKSTPSNMYNISSIICGTEGSIKTAANFNAKVESAVKTNGAVVFLMHGIDNDPGGWSPTQSSELRAHIEYVKENDDRFWVATFGNMIRYIRERNAVSVTQTSAQDTTLTVLVSDTLDNAIYNIPVSIRRPLPEGWQSATATQNGHAIDAKVVEIDLVKYIIFDAVPDSGQVLLAKSSDTSVHRVMDSMPESPELLQNYPNPFNPATRITFNLPSEKHVMIKILNMRGQEIFTLTDNRYQAGDHSIAWDGRDSNGNRVSSGTYFYQLIVEEFCNVKKMIVLQ